MTFRCWPFAGNGNDEVREDQWTEMARYWAANGVATDWAVSSFASPAPSNWTSDNLQVTASDPPVAAEVVVGTGLATVRGHWFSNDAPHVLSLEANVSGHPRIDLVVLHLDPSLDALTVTMKIGEPRPDPSPPALEQTHHGVYEIALAQVRIASGQTVVTQSDITDRRVYAVRPACWGKDADKDRFTSAGRGSLYYAHDTRELYVRSATGWTRLTGAVSVYRTPDAAQEVSLQYIKDGLNSGRGHYPRVIAEPGTTQQWYQDVATAPPKTAVPATWAKHCDAVMTTNTLGMTLRYTGSAVGVASGTVDLGNLAFAQPSAARYKDVDPAPPDVGAVAAFVANVRPAGFAYREGTPGAGGTHLGFIAEQVAESLDAAGLGFGAVTYDHDGAVSGVSDRDLLAALWVVVQDLSRQVAALQSEDG